MATSVIRSPRLAGGALLLVVWLSALTTLVVTTSNPVVINQAQVRAAPLVIMARVADLPSGRCEIQQQWGSRITARSVSILGLEETGARAGESYLFALQPRSGETYEIVAAGKDRSGRPIYPATPDSIARMEELLGE